MAGTNGEEAIVEGHEDKGGRKSVNNDKDAHPAKRIQLEDNETADCRNLGGDQGGEGEEEEREEEGLKEKLDRLRGLLEEGPKKLGNKDVKDVICYLDVDEIISLALKSDQGNESEQCWVAEVENWTEEEGDCKKEADIARSMLCYMGLVKIADIRLLYEKLSPKAFTTMLLAALDSNNVRKSGAGVPVIKAEIRDMIPKLCFVLPWKLFAHVLNKKSGGYIFDDESDEEEKEEECTLVQKEAAEKCDICFGKARHTGSSGDYCTFKDAIPYVTNGTTVGTNYWIACKNCGYLEYSNTFRWCLDCGHGVGQAVPAILSDDDDDDSN